MNGYMKYRTWVGLTGGNTVTVTEWKSIYCEKKFLLFLLLPTNINSFFFLALEQSNTANAWKCNENMREGLWHREDLYRLVVQLGLQLLWISHLPHSLHEVFLGDILTVRADGKQTCKQTQHESADHRQRGLTKWSEWQHWMNVWCPTCFCAHVSQISSIETIWQLHNGFIIWKQSDDHSLREGLWWH